MNEPLWVWLVFNAFVVMMIFIDLAIPKNKAQAISIPQALVKSSIWILLALLFNGLVYVYLGQEAALNFLAGYLIEKTLSLDNLFVFLMIFHYFQTPPKYQHQILFWGIIGAILMRALFIFIGISLINKLHWIIYLFAIFLLYASFKMIFAQDKKIHPENNPLLKLLRKWIPLASDYSGHQLFVKRLNGWLMTPLFVVLMSIETADLIFALDSIPAVLAITRDPFIVYTSNIFAILGLRSLYFALAGLIPLFHHLHYGLAAILAFVSIKMLLSAWIEIPISIVLAFITLAIVSSIVASKYWPKQDNINTGSP